MSVAAVTYEFLEGRRSPGRGGATARAYAALREAIVRMEFKPGEWLDKQAIAGRLGVSRFPVGEALGKLATEGLVDILPQSGSRVALIRLSDARENMFLRRAVETEAIRMQLSRINPTLIENMERNLGYQEAAVQAQDREGFYAFDLQFHDVLLDGLGFERVRQVVETARLGLERVRRLLAPRRQELTLDEHRAILDGIRKGDAALAVSAMERHLGAVLAELEIFATQQPDLFADLVPPGDRKT